MASSQPKQVVKRRTATGVAEVVSFRRSGSGGCVVHPPKEAWLKAVRMTCRGGLNNYEPYTKFRFMFMPESHDGYDDMPGCAVQIVPGDHEGQGYLNSNQISLPDIPSTKDLLEWPVGNGMLELMINFEDLVTIHGSLGRVIASMKVAKKKAKKADRAEERGQRSKSK